MARVRLINGREGDLTPEQMETFDWVVESRGRMLRPFEVLLHSPQWRGSSPSWVPRSGSILPCPTMIGSW